jgi:hypothetical protein
MVGCVPVFYAGARPVNPLQQTMATGPDPDVERKGDVVEQRADDSGSADEKPASLKVEDAAAGQPTRGRLQPPPFIASLTPEQREDLEKKLKRKIDWRLLPAVIIMYIMNYIDRYV